MLAGFLIAALAAAPPSAERPTMAVVITGHEGLAFEEALVWATDLNSGQPLANLPVSLYDQNFQKLVDGVTDADGLVSLTLPPRPDLWTQVYAVSHQVQRRLQSDSRTKTLGVPAEAPSP